MTNTLTALLLATSLLASEPKIQRDVPYADSKNPKQLLDIYEPTEAGKHPIVFWIHGGGWQGGTKAEVAEKPRAFTEKGFVLISADYRLYPETTIDHMAGDMAKAIRWTRDHAKEFGGDPDTIFVMGHSAGAQLAALVCIDDRYLKAEGLSPSMIKGCVPVDGDTYDVPVQVATVEEKRAKSYRMKFGDEEKQKNLSPITHVAKGKGIPPFLILHVADHPETRAQSQKLAKALTDAGVAATAFPGEGKNHTTINADLGKPGDAPSKAMFEFVDGLLKRP